MHELDDETGASVCEALESYTWRSIAPDLLARVALAARDRHRIEVLLGELAGTVAGSWDALAPVDADDIRVAPVTEFLTGRPWRERSLDSLVPDLLEVLRTWWFRWQWGLGDDNAPST